MLKFSVIYAPTYNWATHLGSGQLIFFIPTMQHRFIGSAAVFLSLCAGPLAQAQQTAVNTLTTDPPSTSNSASNSADTAATPPSSTPLVPAQPEASSPSAASFAQGWTQESSIGSLGLGLGASAHFSDSPLLSAYIGVQAMKLTHSFNQTLSKVDGTIQTDRALAGTRWQLTDSGLYLVGGIGYSFAPSVLQAKLTPMTPGIGNVKVSGTVENGSAIAIWNDTVYPVPAMPDGFTHGGTHYTAQQINTGIALSPTLSVQSVKVNFKFNTWQPYLGLGWASPAKELGWSFRLQAAGHYMGSPQFSATVQSSAPNVVKALVLHTVDKEFDKIRGVASKLKIYPEMSASLQYRFD